MPDFSDPMKNRDQEGQRPQWVNRPHKTGRNNRDKNNVDAAFTKGQNAAQDNGDITPSYQPTPNLLKDMVDGGRQQTAPVARPAVPPAAPPRKPVIGRDQVRKASEILQKYKRGKQNLEDKIVKNEKWWKMRHWDLMETRDTMDDPKPASGWLFNVLISKHADFMDSFPSSDILPREEGDIPEAQRLSSIIPVIMDQNGYKSVFSEEVWYKLKHGTGVFGIFWDQAKLGGLGDITIKSMDLLQIFWEPGVTDIQQSANLFTVELVDNEAIMNQFPEARGKLNKTNDTLIKKYWYDDKIDTTGKSAVVDWYYKKTINGKQTLQYVKYVDDIVLYATENDTKIPTEERQEPVIDPNGNTVYDAAGLPAVQTISVPVGPSMAQRGLYDHGKYPFVFDVLFPEAGMPVGFGFVDVCKNAQTSIDIYNNAFEKNVEFCASPRYIIRGDGGLNEEEFADPHKILVHTEGNLGQDSYAPIQTPTFINSNYIAILDNKINEMKETAGNRDATNGGTQAGVTAASAIAAMQEASGKTSRDQISTTYEAHKKVVDFVIELIRQFYNMPRQFRILGERGQAMFTQYSNQGLQPQYQGNEFGVDMGFRLPVFDIKVEAEKSSAYSQLSQNELALQFYNQGFFNPQYTDQALACIDMMEFQGKQQVVDKIQRNGGMYRQLLETQQQVMQMAEMIDQLTGGEYGMAQQYAQVINGQAAANTADTAGNARMPQVDGESAVTENARERAAKAAKPR